MAEGKSLYAVVMLKGTAKVTRKVVDTLKNLRMSNINNCVIVPADGTYKGMLKRVAEYVTWGEIDQETLENLLEKKGRLEAKAAKAAAAKAVKEAKLESGQVFRLSPMTGGMKTVRLNYPKGETGYRGAEINSMLKRMI